MAQFPHHTTRSGWSRGFLTLACCFSASAAFAAPGDHIRAGDTTITPDVDLGFEYATNVYRAEADPTPGANLRVSPGLTIGVDSPNNSFDLSGEWRIRQFLFVGSDTGPDRAERINALSRYNDFNLAAKIDTLKNETVGLVISESASLMNNQADNEFSDAPYSTQVRNSLGGGVRVSPGPALGIVPGGTWRYDDFRLSEVIGERQRFNSRNAYGPTMRVQWNFFPRTSLVLDTSYMLHRWSENEASSGEQGVSTVAVPDSNQFRIQTGIQGRFTQRIFVDLMVGYGMGIYDAASVDGALADVTGADDDLNGLAGLLVTTQIRYKLAPTSAIALGYNRSFEDSFFTNYVLYNQLYAELKADVANGFQPSIRYGVRFEEYVGGVVRSDVFSRFDANLSYNLSDWSTITLGGGWQQRAIAQTELKAAEYNDVRVNLLSTFRY